MRIRITRDLVLFAVGLAGTVHQTLANNADRPYLLALFAGMMGLPVFLNLDAKKTTSVASEKKDQEGE